MFRAAGDTLGDATTRLGPMIRLATPSDGARLAAIYAPAVLERSTSFGFLPPDADEMGRRVTAVMTRTPWLVLEDAGRVMGYAYASLHRDRPAYQWSVEVSAYIDDGAHRSGIGRRLYTVLFEILERQGYVNAYAGITLPNAASVGFHRVMGFKEIGTYPGIGFKFGAWHDVAWYYRTLIEPRPVNPPPPRLLPELLEKGELGGALAPPGRT